MLGGGGVCRSGEQRSSVRKPKNGVQRPKRPTDGIDTLALVSPRLPGVKLHHRGSWPAAWQRTIPGLSRRWQRLRKMLAHHVGQQPQLGAAARRKEHDLAVRQARQAFA